MVETAIKRPTVLVVYDTSYGNTAVIAKAICSGLGGNAIAREVETLDADSLSGFDTLVVGSPTQGGRPTQSVRSWLDQIPAGALQGSQFAAFDTRLPISGLFGTAMRIVGHAAPRIARGLRARGAREIAPAEGFVVINKDGPLAQNEKERAVAWGKSLAEAARHRSTG